MTLSFPGVALAISNEMLTLKSEQTLSTLSSAVVGGGLAHTHTILSVHVDKNFNNSDPVNHLTAQAAKYDVQPPFVGLMTAVFLNRARAATVRHDSTTVAAVVTAGVGNLTAAGQSEPTASGPGTINIMVLVDANLTAAGLVNAAMTATEVKTKTLCERGALTAQGHVASGTSSDAIVIACTGRGPRLPYAGTATDIGWLIGRAVRQAFDAALDATDKPSPAASLPD